MKTNSNTTNSQYQYFKTLNILRDLFLKYKINDVEIKTLLQSIGVINLMEIDLAQIHNCISLVELKFGNKNIT